MIRPHLAGVVLAFASGACTFRDVEPKSDAGKIGNFDPRPQATPAGTAVGRSSWKTLPPGARVKAVSKKGTFVGSFIAYHDGILWLDLDGGGRKALDALEIARLQVLETK